MKQKVAHKVSNVYSHFTDKVSLSLDQSFSVHQEMTKQKQSYR